MECMLQYAVDSIKKALADETHCAYLSEKAKEEAMGSCNIENITHIVVEYFACQDFETDALERGSYSFQVLHGGWENFRLNGSISSRQFLSAVTEHCDFM
jgi:hypothetical protein